MKLRVRASRFLIIPLLVLTIFSSFFETAAVASIQAKSRPGRSGTQRDYPNPGQGRHRRPEAA